MSCGRKIGDFDCCSIVQGDCLELMKRLNRGSFDAVVTDPPYGGGYAANPILGKNRASEPHKPQSWDKSRPDLSEIFRVSEAQAIWGGNYYDLRPSRGWLVWHKPDALPSMADCELCWTSRDMNTLLISHTTAATNVERCGHPTQKPLRVMDWTIRSLGNIRNVLDPFSGSGTTLVAAKMLGIHYLGFELNPDYCAIAQRRLDEIDAQPTLFAPRPEQLTINI